MHQDHTSPPSRCYSADQQKTRVSPTARVIFVTSKLDDAEHIGNIHTRCNIQVGVVALGAPKCLQYLILDERQ